MYGVQCYTLNPKYMWMKFNRWGPMFSWMWLEVCGGTDSGTTITISSTNSKAGRKKRVGGQDSVLSWFESPCHPKWLSFTWKCKVCCLSNTSVWQILALQDFEMLHSDSETIECVSDARGPAVTFTLAMSSICVYRLSQAVSLLYTTLS